MKGCTGACKQGKAPCPTPTACEIPEDEDRPNIVGTLLIAAALVCALAMVVVFLR